jgi:hypothetical protein
MFDRVQSMVFNELGSGPSTNTDSQECEQKTYTWRYCGQEHHRSKAQLDLILIIRLSSNEYRPTGIVAVGKDNLIRLFLVDKRNPFVFCILWHRTYGWNHKLRMESLKEVAIDTHSSILAKIDKRIVLVCSASNENPDMSMSPLYGIQRKASRTSPASRVISYWSEMTLFSFLDDFSLTLT